MSDVMQYDKKRGYYADLPDLGISITGPDRDKVALSLREALVHFINAKKATAQMVPLGSASRALQEPDVCRGNHGGNPESEAANPSAEAKEKVRLQILDFIRERGDNGATADEVAAAWDCSHNHVAPRISELQDDGRLVPRHRRKTRSGRNARVYVLP
jgi:hypothetical protein